MSKTQMVMSPERWKGMDNDERTWLIYDTLAELNKRIKSLEDRKWWDGVKMFTGGIIGGAAAFLGLRWGGLR